jgi:UDP-GlcNAc:undecaprenyl-phosphate/decaprenyl-phosphate GlcNAc-1-phosphate transferase
MSFIISLPVAFLLTWAARYLGLATGMVDRPAAAPPPGGRALKIHARPVPVLGGVAVLAAVVATLFAVQGRVPVLVTGGVALAALVGLADDVRPLGASSRMLALALAGVLLVAGGVRLVPLGWFRATGVIVLVLLLTNAVNLIDGQDGLAGGLAALAGLGLATLSFTHGGDGVAALAFVGALLGFLAWNLPPARVFLGNSGAYGLGTLLAVLAAHASDEHRWPGLFGAGLCLGVFAFELCFTVGRRLAARERLATGDRRHSYDLLATASGSRTRTTLLLWCLGAVASTAGVLLGQLPAAVDAWLVGAAMALGTVAGVLLWQLALAQERAALPAEDQTQ